MDDLLLHLRQPEYVHVLLNPLPVYGLATATLALALTLFRKASAGRFVALMLVCVTAASAWPVYELGQQGYDRVLSMSDSAGEKWLSEHKHRAEKLILLYGVLAAVSVVAMFSLRTQRFTIAMVLLTLLLAVSTLAAGAWISFAGGQVRHREFRLGPAPGKG